ncbi:MAG: AAA family ATPase, partial [Clostridia bacterium]|nr:AAA family ATPase [Clostridia bacterium]
MLQLIHIENLAVIKSLDLEPCGGLTVLTGETGAGKSVIIDSINFLLGKRVPRDLMRTGEDRASVSALFSGISAERTRKLSELGVECPEGELLIERTRFADGRTVCRINGRAATRQQLVAAGELLVSLHGQNDTRSLEVAEERTALVDSAAGSAG